MLTGPIDGARAVLDPHTTTSGGGTVEACLEKIN